MFVTLNTAKAIQNTSCHSDMYLCGKIKLEFNLCYALEYFQLTFGVNTPTKYGPIIPVIAPIPFVNAINVPA